MDDVTELRVYLKPTWYRPWRRTLVFTGDARAENSEGVFAVIGVERKVLIPQENVEMIEAR